MRPGGRTTWRPGNIPLPEPHLLALAAGAVLHRWRPWRLPGPRPVQRLIGGTLWALGVSLVVRSVAAAGQVELERWDALVTSGVYATTRNPMYLAWALMHAGAGLGVGSAWILAGLPAAVAATHRQVLVEERLLARAFGEDYQRYAASVPRYWGAPPAPGSGDGVNAR